MAQSSRACQMVVSCSWIDTGTLAYIGCLFLDERGVFMRRKNYFLLAMVLISLTACADASSKGEENIQESVVNVQESEFTKPFVYICCNYLDLQN